MTIFNIYLQNSFTEEINPLSNFIYIIYTYMGVSNIEWNSINKDVAAEHMWVNIKTELSMKYGINIAF